MLLINASFSVIDTAPDLNVEYIEVWYIESLLNTLKVKGYRGKWLPYYAKTQWLLTKKYLNKLNFQCQLPSTLLASGPWLGSKIWQCWQTIVY